MSGHLKLSSMYFTFCQISGYPKVSLVKSQPSTQLAHKTASGPPRVLRRSRPLRASDASATAEGHRRRMSCRAVGETETVQSRP